jgi:CHAT domain-containing protein
MTTEAPGALRADACPQPEQVAAYIDGQLGPDERTTVERHLVGCAECRDIVGDAVAARNELGDLPVPAPSRTKLWVACGVVLAAAAAVVLAVRLQGPSPYYVPEMRDLVTAVGETRPIEPRLTGGFAYGPYSVVRGEGSAPSLGILAAAARIEEREKAGGAEAEAALGVAQLATGNARALETLEEADGRLPADPRVKSDLAAAYLVAGRRKDDARLLAKALEYAEQAVSSSPQSVEALFNRALATESLGLNDQARKAWDAYLAVDSTSAWADEARQRRARLNAPNRSKIDELRQRLWLEASRGLSPALTALARDEAFQAREILLSDALERWANAVQHNDSSAGEIGRSARAIADAVGAASGDRLPSDVWAHLQGTKRTPALAEGAIAYVRGRRELEEFHTAAAEQLLSEAEKVLTQARSPLAIDARFQRTLTAYYRREYAAASTTLADLAQTAASNDYLSLSGQIAWRQGLISLVRGSYSASLASYKAALVAFTRTRELDQLASVENALAEGFRYVGEMGESWTLEREALRTIARTWNPRRRHAILLTTARSCLRDDLSRCALAVQDELVANAVAWGEPAALTSSHLQRARALAALDRAVEAEAELSAARAALREIPDHVFAGQYETELALATGEVAARAHPQTALQALAAADEQLNGSGAVLRRPQLLLAKGRAARLSDDPHEAAIAFENGIRIFEQRRTTLPDEELRISMFDDAWALFDEMVRLEVERGASDSALAYLERARGRTLLQHHDGTSPAVPFTPAAIRTRLPDGTVLLYYAVLDDRVYIWALSSAGTMFRQVREDRRDIERLVRDARSAAIPNRNAVANARLYDLLLAPVREALPPGALLAVVPDGVLNTLAFGALFDRARGRPAIADNAVMKTVSGTVFVTGRQRSADRRALVVGDPDFDRAEFPDLSPLPDAEAEAREIARLYPFSTVLLKRDATKRAFLDAARNAGTIHFAGHALPNSEYPWLSRLVFAASTEGSALFAYEVRQLPLDHVNLVVLGACATATGAESRSEGPLSVARPFLAAGVPAVIATLWNVEDKPSRILLSEFHRRVTGGEPPVFALQQAQWRMAQSGDPALSSPAAWAAFEIIGSISRNTPVP